MKTLLVTIALIYWGLSVESGSIPGVNMTIIWGPFELMEDCEDHKDTALETLIGSGVKPDKVFECEDTGTGLTPIAS
jgi:hypothetical protein